MTPMGTMRRVWTAVLCGAALAALTAVPARATGERPGPRWELKETGSTARFRGLSAVGRDTAWVAGSEGTVLRTVDGGRHWADVSPPGAAELQFRDIEAFDARRATCGWRPAGRRRPVSCTPVTGG